MVEPVVAYTSAGTGQHSVGSAGGTSVGRCAGVATERAVSAESVTAHGESAGAGASAGRVDHVGALAVEALVRQRTRAAVATEVATSADIVWRVEVESK